MAASEPIARLNTSLRGRYRVERELGKGGMATVYLARDLKHDREVALKVLKPALAAVVGADRFLAEIRTTANLQHPHILPLHDSGSADGFPFYVMPFVPGESLRERLGRERQLPVDDAVRIAIDLSAALDYAHRQGVIHRDIKPANILMQDGEPVLSDFGIALAVGLAGGGRLTETGLSLGTPHYMSPEQATGDAPIGPASDIYALGCVLYEMLAGEPPYTGSTAQAVLGRIITEPATPLTRSRTSVPGHVEAATLRALERIPADRFATAAAFGQALADPAFRHRSGALGGATPQRRAWSPAGALALVAAGLAAGVALDRWVLAAPPEPPAVVRYQVTLGEGEELVPLSRQSLAISRDGSRIAYRGRAAGDDTQIWIRERDELVSRPVPGTTGAMQPFLSPDGSRVGFITLDGAIRVASIDGGRTITLVEPGLAYYGAAWGDDGYVYFDSTRPHGLERIAAEGGAQTEPVFGDEMEVGVVAHASPSLLPGGRGVIVTVVRNSGVDHVAAIDLETGELTELVEASVGGYAPSGHLVYGQADGSLFAAPFDARSMRLTGAAVRLEELDRELSHLALSDGGRLAYSLLPPLIDEVVWVDREGRETPVDAANTVRGARFLALSPDGRSVAVSTRDHPSRDDSRLFVKDLPNGPLTQLTFDGTVNYRPEWFAGGDSILFISDRGENRDVWMRGADGSAPAQLLLDDSMDIDEALFSPDGRWLVFRRGSQDGLRDIYALRVGSDEPPVPVAASEFDEVAPAISPDGRWLAYAANVEERWDVYVRNFPDGDRQWRVSRNGGQGPVWSRDGRELLYQTNAQMQVSVAVTPGDPITFGEETPLFSLYPYWIDTFHRQYDLSPDGQRFLMIRAIEDDVGYEDLFVVEGFLEELRERVGG